MHNKQQLTYIQRAIASLENIKQLNMHANVEAYEIESEHHAIDFMKKMDTFFDYVIVSGLGMLNSVKINEYCRSISTKEKQSKFISTRCFGRYSYCFFDLNIHEYKSYDLFLILLKLNIYFE